MVSFGFRCSCGRGADENDLERRVARANRPPPGSSPRHAVACTSNALGKELACEARLAEHNRPGAPNRISLIELRTDPKLAGFFAHEPASAEVRLEEADGQVRVVIDEFISPSILERLRQQDGLVSPQVIDWRAMVDCVMIDPSYDGSVFAVGLADVPERKRDLGAGSYTLDAEIVGAMVAVKVTDMLGEEVLVVLPTRPAAEQARTNE